MPFDLPESFLKAAAQSLGMTLPASYRSSMLRNNGGEIIAGNDTWELYPIADSSDRKRLSRTCNHILKETENCRLWERFPRNALAIARNGGGDHLVLVKQDTEFSPEIYVWSHETGRLTKVANNFSELKTP
jgi:hypothetical protein